MVQGQLTAVDKSKAEPTNKIVLSHYGGGVFDGLGDGVAGGVAGGRW